MRVLFTTSPGVGHVFPTVRTAQAFQAAGHEVLYALGGHVAMAASAGMAVVDTAPGVDFSQIFRQFAGDRQQALLGAGDESDGRWVARLFARVSEVTVDATVAVVAQWKPDVVVHTPLQGAGRLIASQCGVPAVEHGIGLGLPSAFAELLRAEMRESYEKHGVGQEPPASAHLDVAPASMTRTMNDQPGDPTSGERVLRRSLRYVPYNGGGVLPDWLLQTPSRPRIALTLGTVLPAMGGLDRLSALLAAAAGVDAEFVLALGEVDTANLPAPPDNVRVCREWIPLGWLLRTCVGAVHHGGAGTTLTTLDAGIPQLLLPHGADQHINAEAVRARGAGHVVAPESINPGDLERLLTDTAARAVAAEVRSEMAAMPAPAAVVPRVVEFVEGRARLDQPR
jgi:UDP:flavonoid glycosyltransferase YjiC (YdhE family)